MDVKVMGTLGISEENLTANSEVKNVQSVEGGHSVDVIARKQGSDEETCDQKLWGRLIN